jgi:hypothetical protein
MTEASGDGRRWLRFAATGVAVALAAVAVLAVASGSAAAVDGNATNASFVYEGERLTLAAESGAEIRAETSLSTGAVVTVRLRSTGSSPFLRSPQATVGRDGEVVTPVDLSRVAPGTTFDATLMANGTRLATASGVVTDCERGCEPTPTTERHEASPEPSDEWLTESVTTATAGDAVRIPVAVPDDDPVTLAMTSGEFRLTATARDTTGDGRVVFRVDTGQSGPDTPPVSVGVGDALVEWAERGHAGRLDPASYDVNVSDGPTATAREVDVGTLVLRECTTCPAGDGPAVQGPERGSATPAWPDDGTPLASAVVTARDGGPTRIPVNVAGPATVTVGSEARGYRFVATVRDETGDGRVALLFYPRNAGTPAPTVAVGGGDSVTVAHETRIDGPLPAATYDIAVRRGTSATGEPDDIGALDVTNVAGNGTATPPGSRARSATGSTNGPGGRTALGAVGAITVGGILAVVGIAVVLGFARS